METNSAKISISMIDGRIEICGSETFVTTQIDNFKEHIITALSKSTNKSKDTYSASKVENATNSTTSLDDYQDIFTLDDDKIKIIPQMTGTTKSKKVVKLAVLYAYAKKLQGIDTASVEEIKIECETHGLMDTNFSSNIKSGDPAYYTDKESGKARFIKINKPGEKYALEILKELNASA